MAGLLLGTVIVAPQASAAALAPDQGLSGNYSSLYQTNNTVETVAVGGGVIYAGGSFTSVRPPGSAKGSNETARTDLAAFSASTGVVTSFNATINGSVNQIALSSDNSTLYLAGSFSTVNGTTRNHFAALTSGGTLTSWNPNASGGLGYALKVTSTGVYIGGTFTKVGNVAHRGLALVNASTGALNTTFTATSDGQVLTFALTTDGSRLLVGGTFNTLAGVAHHALGSLDPTTGADQTFAADGVLPNTTDCTSVAEQILVSGTVAYVAGDGAQPGCFDGNFSVNTSDGSVNWINPCEGSTVAMAVINGVLYKGSHMHDCAYNQGGPGGGFTGAFAQGSRKWYRLIAQDPSTGLFEHWSPNTNGAGSTNIGPFAMATDGTQLIVGGDFTTTNNKAQQGLARFQPASTSGSATPQTPTVAPVATVTGAGTVSVTVPGDWDTDNGVLTYQLLRGTTVVATTTAESWPWAQPAVRFKVTVPNNSTAYTFKYNVSDGTTTSTSSPVSNSVTASAANAPGAYVATVTGQSPSTWWRLNGDATDTTGNNPGQFVGGVTTGTTGSVPGNTAVTLDGSTGYVTAAAATTPTSSFTESVWFKTTTLVGGDLLGYSNNQTGTDSSAGRVIWMDDDGQIASAVTSPPPAPGAPPGPPNSTIRSTDTYNDGAWHQAVLTYDGTTLSQYVDGRLTASAATAESTPAAGYLRAGYTDLTAFNAVFGVNSTGDTSPNSYYFGGALDEVSTYPTALTAAQVLAQYASDASNI